MPLVWKEVRDPTPSSRPGGSGSERFLASLPRARVFGSVAGGLAFLVRLVDLAEAPGVTLELEPESRDQRNLAFLPEESDVGDILKYCDTVALPEDAAEPAPQGLVRCGRARVSAGEGSATVFVLFRKRSVSAERLARGAPRGLGEPDDNLPSREDWFERRHGGKR